MALALEVAGRALLRIGRRDGRCICDADVSNTSPVPTGISKQFGSCGRTCRRRCNGSTLRRTPEPRDGFVEYDRRKRQWLGQSGLRILATRSFTRTGGLADGLNPRCARCRRCLRRKGGTPRCCPRLGRHGQQRTRLDVEAEQLAAFEASFWCEDLIDMLSRSMGAKLPCRCCPNAACPADRHRRSRRAGRVAAATLLGVGCFFRWGIRTVALSADG